MAIAQLLQHHPIIPVVTINHIEQLATIINTLQQQHISIIEITLRTPVALEAIQTCRQQYPNILVGAGTILQPEHYDQAQQAGAQFIVSPGLTPLLADYAQQPALPFLPGVSTISEAMTAMDHGFTTLKLFPASVVGGIALLKAFNSVLPHCRFVPTGGLHAENYQDYLSLDNVISVGGSWVLQ